MPDPIIQTGFLSLVLLSPSPSWQPTSVWLTEDWSSVGRVWYFSRECAHHTNMRTRVGSPGPRQKLFLYSQLSMFCMQILGHQLNWSGEHPGSESTCSYTPNKVNGKWGTLPTVALRPPHTCIVQPHTWTCTHMNLCIRTHTKWFFSHSWSAFGLGTLAVSWRQWIATGLDEKCPGCTDTQDKQ